MKNIIIDGPCNTDCPRFCSGTCPYDQNEKEQQCPLWRTEIKKIQYIIDTIDEMNVFFGLRKKDDILRITASYEVGTIVISVEKEAFDIIIKWKIPNTIKNIEGDENKKLFLLLGLQQIYRDL